ncbi:MAG: hypothetical protein GY792_19220 [Gammaproteobacteria bacterium]|nr:hypothetical protein [Gammaproteobacteria bacterium]
MAGSVHSIPVAHLPRRAEIPVPYAGCNIRAGHSEDSWDALAPISAPREQSLLNSEKEQPGNNGLTDRGIQLFPMDFGQ